MRTLRCWWTTAVVVCLSHGCGNVASREADPPDAMTSGAPASGLATASGACSTDEITQARVSGDNFWTCQSATRYICDDHGNKIAEACPSGCASTGTGHDAECIGGGPSCTMQEFFDQAGSAPSFPSFWTCEGQSRYVCDAQQLKIAESCPNGCQSTGDEQDDQCN